jgi:hypothetical protein
MDLNKSSLLNNEMGETENDLIEDSVYFDLGDFSFESDGSINVILTNYDLNSPIFIYKVSYVQKNKQNKL